MLQADIHRLKHLNRRVAQLKSYRGTEDELPGDEQRLAYARKMANEFLTRCLMWHLGGKRD